MRSPLRPWVSRQLLRLPQIRSRTKRAERPPPEKPRGEHLRILFCGSDHFSAEVLEALKQAYDEERPPDIASIDVVCRASRPSGRGLQTVKPAYIKSVAEKYGFPVHEIPTFKGWEPPTRDGKPMNLVVAASFGLLIPGRIINGAKYGGLNVHPSLLPKWWGAAPLQHSFIAQEETSGITLQTLHPRHFDQGDVLARKELKLNDALRRDYRAFAKFMAEKAGWWLVKNLRLKAHIPPLENLKSGEIPIHASKINTEDRHIDWQSWSTDRIQAAMGAIGPLWNIWKYRDQSGEEKQMRVNFRKLKPVVIFEEGSPTAKPGVPCVFHEPTFPNGSVKFETKPVGGFWTSDGNFLEATEYTIEGRDKGWPGNSVRFVEHLQRLRTGKQADSSQTTNTSMGWEERGLE